MKTKRIIRTRITVWKSAKDGLWYWHATRNQDIVCDGGEGKKRRSTTLRGIANLIQSFKSDQFFIVG